MLQLMERIHETLEGLNGVLFSSGMLTSSIEKDATTLLISTCRSPTFRRCPPALGGHLGRSSVLHSIHQSVCPQSQRDEGLAEQSIGSAGLEGNRVAGGPVPSRDVLERVQAEVSSGTQPGDR